MPGYGRAEKPQGFDYTVAGYARHLDGLLEQLGVRRAHLVMHDFGGAWGLSWAAQHSDKFASATLLGTGVLVGYRWHHWARIWRTPIVGELFMAAAPGWGFKFLIGRENPRLPPKALNELYAAFRPWPTKRAVLKLYRSTSETMFAAPAATLRELDRPALVLWPTADRYLPTEQAERQREAFPSARVELLEGHGHWFFVEDPERVASLVVPFLREQVRPGT
jgi:pimeloyl-ACP methyl ester carboxylesterase